MLWDPIIDQLKSEYDSGLKQTDIAKNHNVAQSVVQRFLKDKRSIAKSKLETISRMFPHATINLHGDNRVNIVKNLSAQMDYIKKIVDDTTMEAEKKIKILKVILEE